MFEFLIKLQAAILLCCESFFAGRCVLSLDMMTFPPDAAVQPVQVDGFQLCSLEAWKLFDE